MAKNDRHFIVRLARDRQDLLASQRLRYRVFVQELGATGPTVDHDKALECDDFDAFYDHLLLVDRRRDPRDLDHVIGVYRLLPGDVAKANKGFYSAAEFDLGPLINSGRRLLELGRSCVDKNHRGGIAMYHLWNGLAEYVLENEIEVMFGVASYHGTDADRIAQSLSYLHHRHLAPAAMRAKAIGDGVRSMDLIAKTDLDKNAALAQTPALIKAYLRLGGSIGEGAYVDKDFNTVDVCLLMDTKAMSRRHRDNYIKRQHRGAA